MFQIVVWHSMFVSSGHEQIVFPLFCFTLGVAGYYNHGQPLPVSHVIVTDLSLMSPSFTLYPYG